MNTEKQYELIAKSLSGNISDQEKAMLEQWLGENAENATVYAQAKRAWELTAEQTVVADTDAAWQKLSSLIAEGEKTEVIRISPVGWFTRIAAAVAVLVGIGFLFSTFFDKQPQMKTIASANEMLKVVLPDSSVVWLNKGSQIAYLENFEGDKREVKLTGEAFFDVVHKEDKPFVIEANKTTITDIGTSFNVRAYSNEPQVEVSVATGVVGFSSTKKEQVILNAGYHAVFDLKSATIHSEQNKSANYMAWKTGQLMFENNTLGEVAATLSRYYNTNIVTDSAAATILFTGNFNHAGIGDAMRILETSTGVEVSKQQNGYNMSAR
ncbi:MAG TPA: FecR domain-containing protein [Chitinophagales bacterium]|nr:FecR domain-containing protein [Chitinophagales bacterium]